MALFALVLSLAQDQGVGQRGPARRDVDGSTARVVQGGEVVEPAVGVPCPAGEGTVDDGCPAEAEDQARKLHRLVSTRIKIP